MSEEIKVGEYEIGAYTFLLLRRADGSYKSEPILDSYKPVSPAQLQGKPEFLTAFPSKSTPGMMHRVYRNPDGSLFCTCTGNRRFGHCWHVDKEKQKEEINNG